jgi:beta-lactamase regulating signal transducer with metallopeptidase domain
MTDLFFQSTVNNVCLSLALALIAATVGWTLKRPLIAHLLWILVLLKLLTPPLVTIPALPMPVLTETEIPVKPKTIAPLGLENAATAHTIESAEAAYVPVIETFTAAIHGRQWLLLAWILGSGIVFARSLFQVLRFHSLLLKKTENPNPEIQAQATAVATSLGLRSIPTILTTAANISPMVWWIGGKVRIVLPDSLILQMNSRPLEWILAHELAHVRRRDYLVRWIEWLVCVGFWWNPVAWWARSNLRANEELCCDALVLSVFKPEPAQYGASLLQAVEILTGPGPRAPLIASGIDGGKLLKNRMRMIVTGRLPGSNLRWLEAGVLLGALVVLPLGLIYAKDRLESLLMAAQTRGENQAFVYGSDWRLSAQVPGGWIGDTFNALEMQANIVIYGDRYTIDTAPALVKIWIGDRDDEDTGRNLQYDLEQLKKRFPNIRSTYITVFHNGYMRDSRLFYVPDGFYEYVTYLNPGKGYPWSVSVVMNKREGEATEQELDAYRKVIQSISLSYQPSGNSIHAVAGGHQ